MTNFITKDFSEAKSPVSTKEWKDKKKNDRIKLILNIINLQPRSKALLSAI